MGRVLEEGPVFYTVECIVPGEGNESSLWWHL